MKNNQNEKRKYNINVKRISAIIIALLMLTTSFSALTRFTGQTTVLASIDGDTTYPDQNITIGEPKIPIIWRGNQYNIIGPHTPIWINSTDNESGSERIEYSVWLAVDLNADTIQWRFLYSNTVYDDDEDGTISAEFYLSETCFHEIRYQCWDNEGNTAGVYTKDVFVDASAPITTKIAGCPQYGDAQIQPLWASDRTMLHFISVDQGCFPGGTGVYQLTIIVWWKPGMCDDQGPLNVVDTIAIVDQDSNDLNRTVGSIAYDYHFTQNGFFEVEFYSIDVFGNTEIEWKQQHRVDVLPPQIIKTHPTHGYLRINDSEGYLKCGLPIKLEATDEPTPTCNNSGLDQVYWRYEYNGQNYPLHGELGAINGSTIAEKYCMDASDISNYWWYVYTTDGIRFNEECQHNLSYFGIDNVGNYGTVHHQIYYVDNTAPYIDVTYRDHGYYQGTVDHLKCFTPITLNAYDNPTHLCQSGVESIFYRY